MKKNRRSLIPVFFCILFYNNLNAQECKSNLCLDSDFKFEVREKFDGTRNASDPAIVQFSTNLENDSLSFRSIDLAIRFVTLNFIYKDVHDMYIYPTFGLHEKLVNGSYDDDNSFNKLTAGLKFEYYLHSWERTPVLTMEYKTENDYKDNENDWVFTSELTFDSEIRYWPGSKSKFENDYDKFYYYPYLGYESHTKFSNVIDNLEFLKARVHFVRFLTDDHSLSLVGDLVYRKELSNNSLSKNPKYMKFKLNYKLTPEFSVTLEFENGESSNLDFQKVSIFKTGIGFKL